MSHWLLDLPVLLLLALDADLDVDVPPEPVPPLPLEPAEPLAPLADDLLPVFDLLDPVPVPPLLLEPAVPLDADGPALCLLKLPAETPTPVCLWLPGLLGIPLP